MKLETFELGKGEPLLFLAGANATFEYYQPFLKLLSKKFKVYFFNYPGLGKSEKFKGGYSLIKYLNLIDRFITERKLDNFHLVGASFGGFLAIKYASQRKDVIKSLILFSPLTKLFTQSKIGNALRIAKTNSQKMRKRYKPLILSVFRPGNSRNFFEKLQHSDFVLSCSLEEIDFAEDVPTLLIVGGKDLIVDSQYTHSLFTGRKNCKIIYFKSEGHDAFATVGDKILSIIEEFINK